MRRLTSHRWFSTKAVAPILAAGLLLAIVPCLCGAPASGMPEMDKDCHMAASAEAEAPCCCSTDGTQVQAESHDMSDGILTAKSNTVEFSPSITLVSSLSALRVHTQKAFEPRFNVPSESPPLYLLNASFLI